MAAIVIRGERGGELLMFNNNIYKRNKRKNGRDYYKCNKDGCRVTLLTLANDLNVINNNGVHNHPPVDDIIACREIFEETKRRINTDPTRHIPVIWEEILDEYEENANYNGPYP